MRKNMFLSITGFLLAFLTVGFQLPQSVAHSNGVASAESAHQSPMILAKIVSAPKPKKQPMPVFVAPAALTRTVSKAPLVASVTPPVEPAHSTYLPIVDQPGIREEHKKIADKIFRMLPPGCVDHLQNFYVKYNSGMKSRGYAGERSVVMDGDIGDLDSKNPEVVQASLNEFEAVLGHEVLGHFNELGCMKGNPASGSSDFHDGSNPIWNDDPSVAYYSISWKADNILKKEAQDADFLSLYAKTDIYEDLAEGVATCITNPEGFRARAKTNAAIAQKLQWIETYVFPQGCTFTKGTGSVKQPWDATKLSYTWVAPSTVAAK